MGEYYDNEEEDFDPRLNNSFSTINSRGQSLHLSDLRSLASNMKRSKYSRRTDIIPSRPSKRQTPSMSAAEIKQPTLLRALQKSIKGLGYITPGSPFDNRPRTLKHDFAFDLAAPIGLRACTFTCWRHGFGGYTDFDSDVLSPALSGDSRTVDGVDLNTAIRDGSPNSLPYLVGSNAAPIGMKSATSLWDLELASWNANAFKPVHDTGDYRTSLNIDPSSVAGLVGSFAVWKNIIPTTDHNYGTPFPGPVLSANIYTDQSRPPFMVNLGPGSVSFSCQNKVPTDAEVEFVVFQIRDVATTDRASSSDNAILDHIEYSNGTTSQHLRGPRISSDTAGFSGKAYSSYDCINDPDYKFLSTYPKHQTVRSPLVEKDRVKFVLKGGALKTVKFLLPAQIYDSRKNAIVSGDPFATTTTTSGTPPVSVTTFTPTINAAFNTLTYIIAVAVNGVVMPVFTYPLSNNTNTATTADHNNISVVDRQSAFSSVLFTGSYIEHPMPCLATPQVAVYNNNPMLDDTEIVVPDTIPPTAATFGFCTGLVSSMPVNVASGNTIVFSQIGDTLIKQDTVD